MEILSKDTNPTLCQDHKNGRPRCANYFLERGNDSTFNSKKYETYFLYLIAKGLFLLRNTKSGKTAKNQELHGNRYIANSRSTAGVFDQTRVANLVVLPVGLAILLSSVIPNLKPTINLSVSCCFRCFYDLARQA